MEHASAPAMTIALALAAGIAAQSLARHLRVPGIVLLLAVGVLLGPDVAGVVLPETLGSGLLLLVGFSVAVVLFEGGMNLDLRRIRREQRAIRQLVTVGALVTAVGAALAARLCLGWGWRLSVLFGTLVIVTGPTVVTPLLRRLKVQHAVATVLEAEGVFIDAVGAIVAVVALEVAIQPSGRSLALGLVGVGTRLGFGVLAGLAGGLLLALLLRVRRLVPEGLENVLVLSLVFLLYQSSNLVVDESGLAAVTLAGLVVGNTDSHVQRDLLEFKEQLTVLLVGMLFVLLAADVRLAEVTALGGRGALVVAALVLIVRPVNVLAGTWGCGLSVRQKLLMGWIGPRGIVAAAVASLFALELSRHGVEGGAQLRALVFLVIAVTVVLAGLTGGGVARLLGLRRRTDAGWVVLGASRLGRELALALREGGEEVVSIDANPLMCKRAEQAGLRVVYGNAMEERTLHRAGIDSRAGAIGATANEEVNYLFVQRAKAEGKLRHVLSGLEEDDTGVDEAMVHAAGATVLFGRPRDVQVWSVRLRHGDATVETRRRAEGAAEAPLLDPASDGLVVPLVSERGGCVRPLDDTLLARPGDRVTFVVSEERRAEADAWFEERGWEQEASLAQAQGVRGPNQEV